MNAIQCIFKGGRMEHRLSKRVQGKLGLLIYKRKMPVATGQIKDISRQGLFIATDYDDIQLNQTVELEFHVPGRQKNPFRKLKALVVRKTDNGLGVDFDEVENDSFAVASLIKWLDRCYLLKGHFPVR